MKRSFSVGTDIVEVARIGRLIRRPRFLERIFSAPEVRYCKAKKNAAQHFAVRFAAKEAVWKALGDRFKNNGISHREITVERDSSGKPRVLFSRRLKKYETKISLSLSHTKEYAVAVALLHA